MVRAIGCGPIMTQVRFLLLTPTISLAKYQDGKQAGRREAEMTPALRETEADLLENLIGKRGLATILGWHSLHIRPARVKDDTAPEGYSYRTPVQGDGKDFPDLLLVKPPRCIVAELKREGEKPRPGQVVWLDLFSAIEVVETYLWTTSDEDWQEIQDILTLGHVPNGIERLEFATAWVNRG